MPAAIRPKAWYHTFVSTLYILPIFGAISGRRASLESSRSSSGYRSSIALRPRHPGADGLVGRAHASSHDTSLAIGLFQIALGAGGIKPCVSTNVGDQFGETNKHLLPTLFNWFYFSINAGSAISTLIIPWLLEPWHADRNGLIRKAGPALVCFLESPRLHSPDIAFGLPGIFMVIATDYSSGRARKNSCISRRPAGSFLTMPFRARSRCRLRRFSACCSPVCSLAGGAIWGRCFLPLISS